MLRGLLMKELTILVFGDDLYCIILDCGSVEFVSKGFPDDRTP
jgi:hypothetical protein